MKRVIILISVALLIVILIWYGESRSFVCSNGKCVTVWKTYNNTCYIIPGKYYGLIKPSSRNYIKTSNRSSGADLIWKVGSNTILAQIDDDSQIFNKTSNQAAIINYKSNEKSNDSLYTYFDTKLKVRRYKKNIDVISVSIDNMGAL